ncbi:MAG TPA: hypothetical protein DD381_08435 [Lentisphaeria bacterium]|nr:MAG: hypothetical protein A2X47_11255 [Lentisphaerae bacterium GWF2_38_69]HBM16349.1 hypothetical protein [Lentisphaeria bacterium]
MNKKCTECIGIDKNPLHYNGDIEAPESIIRCILYEAFTLGIAIQAWTTGKWQSQLIYDVGIGKFSPSEVLKSIALVKIRLLFDFMYNSDSTDDFIMCKNFSSFGIDKQYDTKNLVGFQANKMFTRNSINKFIAHLTKQRITKPKCIPQPKFLRGDKATISNAKVILKDVNRFVISVIDHKSFGKLDDWGNAYLTGFKKVLKNLGLS